MSAASRGIGLVIEPGYPYEPGPEAEWTADLVSALEPARVSIFAVLPGADEPRAYVHEVPPHVERLDERVLSGPAPGPRRRAPFGARARRVRARAVARLRPLVEAIASRTDPGGADADPAEHVGRLWPCLGVLSFYAERWGARGLLSERGLYDLLAAVCRERAPKLPARAFVRTIAGILGTLARLLERPLPPTRVIHALGTGYAGVLGAYAAGRAGVPLVVTEPGIYAERRRVERARRRAEAGTGSRSWQREGPEDVFEEMAVAAFELLGRLVLSRADVVTVDHEAALEPLVRRGLPRGRGRVLGRGVDGARFGGLRSRGPERAAGRGTLITFYGRFIPADGLKEFVSASKLLVESLELVDLLALARGERSPGYVQDCLVRGQLLGVERLLRFSTEIGLAEMLVYTDVLVLPGVLDEEPPGLLEALAAGVPVVASDTAACREVLLGRSAQDRRLGPAGVLVPIGDSSALADAVRRVVTEPGRWHAMARAGQERARRYYRRSEALARFLALYDERVERRARPREVPS